MSELSFFLCLPTSSSRDWTALSCGTSVSMSLGALASSQLMRASPTCKWFNVEACKQTQGACSLRSGASKVYAHADWRGNKL